MKLGQGRAGRIMFLAPRGELRPGPSSPRQTFWNMGTPGTASSISTSARRKRPSTQPQRAANPQASIEMTHGISGRSSSQAVPPRRARDRVEGDPCEPRTTSAALATPDLM
ncbi:hypothetical protein BC567DRAFT_231942 [Phyllosticta citribraziliensis]